MFAGNNSDYAMKNKTNLQPLSGGSRDIDSLPLFMDPTVDWAFKFIFSHDEVLRKLLNDLLPVDVGDIEYLPNEIPVQSEKDKRSVFDVICKDRKTGEEFIVEMQSHGDSDMDNRLLFYGSAVIYNQIRRGDLSYQLRPVYVVCLANYQREHTATPDDKIFFRYTLREMETNEPYGNQLMICRLELLRLRKQAARCEGNIEKWAYYLKKMPTFAEKPEDEAFAPFFEAADLSQLPDKDKQDYYLAMKTEYEMRVATEYSFSEGMKKGYNVGIEKGIEKGMEQGISVGIEQGKADMARALLARGVDRSIVSAASGISEEELEGL